MKATAEYVTANIAVWWDMKDCPIPEGYEAGRVRPSLEAAFKEKGYRGPVSITAYGDQTQTPGHILQGLLSTGVSVAHTRSESTCHLMYEDMVEWRDHNPPPATMMIISDQVGSQFTWDLVRQQQQTLYNLFLAYSIRPTYMVLCISEEWCWKKLLKNKLSAPLAVVKCGAKFYCKSCNFDSQSPQKFRKHLSSYKHAREEYVNPTYNKVVRYTEDWGRNYKATPEFATAKIQVWWDLFDCPIPEGYDARQVRPSIETAFKELGYSGPVSISAYGDLNDHTPPIQALSSTGVDTVHTLSDFTHSRMFNDMINWHHDNPPQTAAIMMVISDNVVDMSSGLVGLLQVNKYNFFLAYTCRPYKMSFLLTSAEWLWESLLAGSGKTRLLLQKCSTESGSRESTAMFYCNSCRFDTKSIDNFRAHISSDKKHAQQEKSISACSKSNIQNKMRFRVVDYDRNHWPEAKNYRKSKYMKKAARTGFGFLHNQLVTS